MENLKKQLSEYGVSLKKSFGQNFLTDPDILDAIVDGAGVNEDDEVLEIGAGAGALTAALCRKAKRVVAYEIDSTLKPVLKENLSFAKNVETVFGDIMKESMERVESRFGKSYKLVANLPYYITTPIVMRFVEKSEKAERLAVMVQEEVAERFAAKAGQPGYGAVTVGINLRGEARMGLRVPREKFTPVPKVDSAVAIIDVDRNKFKGADLAAVRKVVSCAFSSRRKTLENNLMNGFSLTRADARETLAEARVKDGERGERLSAEDFVRLAEIMKKRGIVE